MATEHRPGTPAIDYRPDQLVVALEHRDAVLRMVGDMGLDGTAGDASADLGLGLVDFVEGAVRRWQELQPADVTVVDGSPVSPVDSLLLVLRRRFAEEHAGWVPTLGKNRFVRRVEGEHVIGGGIPPSGAEGDPELLYTGSVTGVGGAEGDPELLYTATAPYLVAGGGVGEPGSAAEAGWALVPRGSGPGAGVHIGLADTLLFPNGWLAGACLGAADTIWTRGGTGRPPPVEAHAAFVAGVILR
ncbi:MAG TPA: hypothetical protein VKP11_09820, partial [Frankiaceae bacterium]|nr:hypothetical protein [Frankiaceae bacterium]